MLSASETRFESGDRLILLRGEGICAMLARFGEVVQPSRHPQPQYRRRDRCSGSELVLLPIPDVKVKMIER